MTGPWTAPAASPAVGISTPPMLSVGALVQAVADTLDAGFAWVGVRGELAAYTRAASGHSYFTLKDASGSATLRCALFRRAGQALDFTPAPGQQVECLGRVAVYEARGELQLVVQAMRRVGAGALHEEFLRRKALLEAEGLFDPDRKRPLPSQPAVVGVITSRAGAALHDVLTALARRAPHVRVRLYPTPVQGAAAPPAIAQALASANARRAEDGCEVLILCRGGGSLEDLWAFNDERVVRAVAASALPVVTGVGHETDVTLADWAADLRAPTPTAAAELVTPTRAALLAELTTRSQRLQRAVQRRLETAAQGLDRARWRLGRPAQVLAREQQALHQRHLGLARGLQAQLAQAERGLAVQRARLAALDPRQVLARGYVWLQGRDGTPVMSAAQVQAGDALIAVWADGEADITVARTRPHPA